MAFLSLYWRKNEDKFASDIKKIIKDYPIARFAVGVAAFPVTVFVQSLTQVVGKQLGMFSIEASRRWMLSSDWEILTFSKLINRSFYPIGAQMVFGDFLQSYLLDKPLSSVLGKIKGEWKVLPQSTEGKCLRVIAASFAYAMWCRTHSHGFESYAKICNDFVIGFMANFLTMYFNSNVPGMALYLVDQHLTPPYAAKG